MPAKLLEFKQTESDCAELANHMGKGTSAMAVWQEESGDWMWGFTREIPTANAVMMLELIKINLLMQTGEEA
jgi:hypothetical protein